MTRRFERAICALDRERPSTRGGEHVWPTWFIDDLFPATSGPFTTWVAGVVQTTRDRVTPRRETSFDRVKLPCCATCNGELNRRFEVPAKPIVRRLMASAGVVRLDPGEARTLGLWLLKTWLLLAHPSAVRSHHGPAPKQWSAENVTDGLYDWTINGAMPPTGLSVWVAREGTGPPATRTRRIQLPTVEADDSVMVFQVFRCAVQFLDVTLAYHPGWEIEHPLEGEGRAARLWPPNGLAVDFSVLPPVPPRDTVWMNGPLLRFAPGAYPSEELQPLSADRDPMFPPPPGVIFAAAPRIGSAEW